MVNVCVLGLGKIGLPMAVFCADRGCSVVGADINPAVVDCVNAGRPPFEHEPGLEELMPRYVARGTLRATTDLAAAVGAADVILVLVPVGLTIDHQPDLSAMDAAAAAISRGLRPGSLIVIETTLPVGTTRDRFARALAQAGLICGSDFFLAFSPERVQSNRIFLDVESYPKVVGGIDAASTEQAASFYRDTLGLEVLTVSSAEVAEFTKLAESIYRDVNIALANEFAMFAHDHGIDISEVIATANSEPQSHIHQPGVGVGGHCIPVYPYFITNQSPHSRLASLARTINDGMPAYALDLLRQSLGDLAGRTLLILGLAYRANVKEPSHSPALELVRLLRQEGARVLLNDPFFSDEEIARTGAAPSPVPPGEPVDGVIIQSLHTRYGELDPSVFEGCRVVLDGRNVLEPSAIGGRGVQYIGIGRPPLRGPATRPAEASP